LKRIGLLSDTHSWLDPRLLDHFSACDEIWHAGDLGNLAISDELSRFKPLRAVYGNIDDQKVRIVHPEHLLFTVEGLKVYITHIGGYPGAYFNEARRYIEENKPGLFICGHSHICKVMRDQKYGLIHINPGAAGKHGFHKIRTAVRFMVEAGKIKDLEVIELGLRGEIEP
jgi:putative phosphoesterase